MTLRWKLWPLATALRVLLHTYWQTVRAWNEKIRSEREALATERAALAAKKEALRAVMAAWSPFDIIVQLIADEAANNEPNEADSQLPEYALVRNDI
mmetsp:Transcript_18031/g.45411  ORF Transcript_18031/g.45411 Transcript_18031/m.45411 type:complete len:97 (-) Transcript_18031:1386-1676(-)